MKVQSIQSTSFNAKLNIESVKTNTTKMQNVARLFSDKTMEYSNAEMFIFPRDKTAKFQPEGVSIYAYAKNNPAEVTIAELKKDVWEKFLTYSDEFIANKLTKLFKLTINLSRDKDNIFDSISSIAKRYGDNKKYIYDIQGLYAPVLDYMRNSVQSKIDNDKILSTWDVRIF